MPKTKVMKAAMGGSVEDVVQPSTPPAPLITPKFEMAKGGKVAKQTQRMLKEGGMMQEGGTVDPVSGNDVPTGAMQEEVRDDIPAQLSEGEFVFPADVVRYIGLERLMMMRQAAKEGLGKMEDMGQMSNAEEATEEDDGEFESQIDEIMGEMGEEEEVEMAVGGDVRAKVGEPTGEMSEAGRPLYKTADGEIVSEKSITVPFAGEYVNVPSIQDGIRYDDAEIEDMLASGKIKPTSTHKTIEEAVNAAKARSNTLIKPKMAEGGMAVTPPMIAQTQQAMAPEQQIMSPPAAPPEPMAPAVPANEKSASAIIAEDIQREGYTPEQRDELNAMLTRVAGAKAVVLRDKNTLLVGSAEEPGILTMKMFSTDTPEDIRMAVSTIIKTLKSANIKGIKGETKNEDILAEFETLGYPPSVTEVDGTYQYTVDMKAESLETPPNVDMPPEEAV